MKFFKRKQPGFNPDDTSSLIEACMENDPVAQKLLVEKYYAYAKSIGLRYASDPESAKEIVSDSFLKVFNNLNKYDHSQSFQTWLRAIVVNTAIDYYRKNLKKLQEVTSEIPDRIDLNEDILYRISAREILGLIQKLSPAYRMVFSLYVLDGYTHKEIAEMLGISEGTSKSNLQDARKKLQAMILKFNPNLLPAYALKNLRHNEN